MKPGSTYTHTDGNKYLVVAQDGKRCAGCAWRTAAGCRNLLNDDSGCLGVILEEIDNGTHTGRP